MTALAGRVAGLRGWRRHALAALLGVGFSAALPPLYLVPLLVPAFAGLLWLLDGARRAREAMLIGWSFGFGHMVTGLYWIGIAFLVDAERFGALMPFAVAGLAAGLALFPALVTLAVRWIGWRGMARVALLATAWLVAEWLRSWILTGFPWNLAGNVWAFSPAMLQLSALTGVWGLSLLTVLAAAAPAVLGEAARGGAVARRHALFAAAMLLVPALVWAGGAWRLAQAPAPGAATVEGVRLRLVQPSIEQSLKWDPVHRRQHVERQIALSQGPGFEAVSHVIWAETAVPYLLDEEEALRQALARIVPPGGLLITGAPRAVESDGTRRLRNSLLALDASGRIVGTYDKHHLVPFGEYTPLRGLFGLARLAVGDGDFAAGSGALSLALPGLPPTSPLICYEAIFPGQVAADGARPAWLLNVTNDAWFGQSTGPYQHFASARIRAVEEGLPLIRVANSGISAVVDSYGRLLDRLGLGEVGVLDSALPEALPRATLYARVGNWAVLVLVVFGAVFGLVLRRFAP